MSLVLVTAMLFTGNFAFAVTHLDCMIDNMAHHECEMECCKESDCCAPESAENTGYGAVKITSNDNCCDVHVEQAMVQDDAIILGSKTIDKLIYELSKTSLSVNTEYKPEYTRLITHKFKTTNIYLSVSNLRI